MDKLALSLKLDIRENNSCYEFFITFRIDKRERFYVDLESSIFPENFHQYIFSHYYMKKRKICVLKQEVFRLISCFLEEERETNAIS